VAVWTKVEFTGINQSGDVVSQETILVENYYDETHLFDQKKWFQENKIFRTISRFLDNENRLVQFVDMIHDENGLPVREVFRDEKGQERINFYNTEAGRMVFVGFDINLIVKFRFDIQMSSWRHVSALLPILKDPIGRKTLGIRKIIYISTHPTGEHLSENEFIFSDQGQLMNQFEKREDGSFQYLKGPFNIA